MLCGVLLIGAMPMNVVQAVQEQSISNVAEYEVVLTNTTRIFVSNDETVSYEVGDKYYLTYTVSEFNGTPGLNGVATTTDRANEYPYTIGGGMKFNRDASLLTVGCTYTVCVEATTTGRTYTVEKSDGTNITQITFSESTGTITAAGTTHFGLMAVATTGVNGKLTNVKCYDESGNDLGVWGNESRGVLVTEVEEEEPEELQEYEVTISNSGRVFVCNDDTVDYTVGDKYYLTYTVSEITYTPGWAGVATSTDRTAEYAYETGGVKFNRDASMLSEGYTYTICAEMTSAGRTYTVTKTNGTDTSTITLNGGSAGTIAKDGTTYFGLIVMGTGISGKLTNVTCYDESGNDLGVWGNESRGVVVTEVEEEPEEVKEYEVTISNSARVFVCNDDTVDYTVGDKYYLTYTVSEITYTPGWAGVATSTDRTAEYAYETGGVKFNRDASMLSEGYTYTICAEMTSAGRTYTVTKTNGTDTSTITLNGGSAGTIAKDGTTYFGLIVMGSGISGKLTNVTCYDELGNDLGVWGNESRGVLVTEAEEEEPEEDDITEYEVALNNTARVFVSNDETVSYEVGDKYYLTYTVAEIGGTTTLNGVGTTTDRTAEYPYETGGMKFERDARLLVAGYTYTICVENTTTGRTYIVTKTNGSSSTEVTLSQTNGTIGKSGTTHFGLVAMGTGITGKLTNVKCYDEAGNDLGVWGNESRGVLVTEAEEDNNETPQPPVNPDETPNIDHVSSHTVKLVCNATSRAFVANGTSVDFTEGDKYFLTYHVESANGEATITGIATSQDRTTEYPYESGGMKFNRNSSMLEAGWTYTICIEETETERIYNVKRVKGSEEEQITLTESAVNFSADGTTFFGLLLMGTSISGELTNVKCYDQNGTDLGVWGNEFYGVEVSDTDNETEEVVPSGVAYDVYFSDAANVFVGNNKKVKFEVGDTFYLTYKVSEVESNAIQSGITVTKDNTVEYPHTKGGLCYEQTSKLLETGYTYTLSIKALEAGLKYTVTKTKGNAVENITFVSKTGNFTADNNYFGIWTSAGKSSGKLTDVQCYDANGNDLGVYGNWKQNIIVFEKGSGYKTNEDIEYSYSFSLKDAARIAVSNRYVTDSDVVYLEYQVKNVKNQNSITQSGVLTTSNPSADYPHAKDAGELQYEFNNEAKASELLQEGAQYIIRYEKSKTQCKAIVMRSYNGVSEYFVYKLKAGKYNYDNPYFALWIGDSCSVTADFVNVKCYDEEGNNLAILTNKGVPVKQHGAVHTETPNVSTHNVYFTEAANIYIGNNKKVNYKVGDKYYLTYTVNDIESNAIQSGVGVTTDNTIEYPHTKGGMYYDRSSRMLDVGYNYTICIEVVDDGMKYTITKIKGNDVEFIDFTYKIGDMKSISPYFGMWTSAGKSSGKLTNVKCYDQYGIDLGVYGNWKQKVVVYRSGGEMTTNKNVGHSYSFSLVDASQIAISNKVFTDSNKVYLEYTVKNVTNKDKVSQSGFLTTSQPTATYPHGNSMGQLLYEVNNEDTPTKLLEEGAQYVVSFEKMDEECKVIAKRTLKGKAEYFVFQLKSGVYDEESGYISLWIGDSCSLSADFENVKCYDKDGNNLGIQTNKDVKVSHYGELEDYAQCEAVYYCKENQVFFELDADCNVSKWNDGDSANTEGSYSIEDTTLSVNMNGVVEKFEYIFASFRDEQGNKYIRLNSATVTFVSDEIHGDELESVIVTKADNFKLTKPIAPEQEGRKFDCWVLGTGEEYDFNSVVTENMTLYARWDGNAIRTLAELLDNGIDLPTVLAVSISTLMLGATIAGVFVMKGRKNRGKNTK